MAGPAFNAGRYGTACGAVCEAVANELNIPTVTGMYEENPGVDMFKKATYIVKTADSARGMKDAIPVMAKLVLKQLRGEPIGKPEEEGYIPKGVRINYFADKIGAVRAVDMFVKKLKGEPYTTEYPMPVFDRVPPNPPVANLAEATIALVTSGELSLKATQITLRLPVLLNMENIVWQAWNLFLLKLMKRPMVGTTPHTLMRIQTGCCLLTLCGS